MKYQRVNRNSLAQFRRTRIAVIHESAAIASSVGPDLLVHHYVVRPGKLRRNINRNLQRRAARAYGGGKRFRRQQKFAARVSRET